jgi:hypothetical protein
VALETADIIPLADMLYEQFERERQELDVLRQYVVGKQGLPLVIPGDAPLEVREMARISRINIIAIVVNALVESLFVDNMRAVDDPAAPELDASVIERAEAEIEAESESDDVVRQIWDVWQANKLDRGQSGLYRAVFTYGYGYMLVTAGIPKPVVRPVSPRMMTAMYGSDPDWPEYALEKRRGGRWDLIEQTHVYELGRNEKDGKFSLLGEREHGLSYCPVIRYVDAEDLDLDDEPSWPQQFGGSRAGQRVMTEIVAGQVAPLMTLQDQQDVTTFGLLSAQWYSAFRQRWIIGWTPESRTAKISAAASQMWTFEDSPDDIKIGEFSETQLEGYLRSRDATARFAATLSQTPVHELIGELVNLSAEALAAAEAGRDRKVDLRKTGFGESHEQMAGAVGDLLNIEVPEDIETVWRDTSARAFGALVDGLGKLAQMLEIPPEALWERVPGATRQEIIKWKAARREGDAMAGLTRLLDQQATPPTQPAIGAGGEQRTQGGLILPLGVQA